MNENRTWGLSKYCTGGCEKVYQWASRVKSSGDFQIHNRQTVGGPDLRKLYTAPDYYYSQTLNKYNFHSS